MIKVESVKPEKNYRLNVILSNGKKGIFDMKPYLDKGVFAELKDVEYFNKVRPFFLGIVWPNEQDISADTISHELIEN